MSVFYPPPTQPASQVNSMAVTSLVLGSLAILGSWIPLLNTFSILLAVAAFVFALVAFNKKRRHAGRGLAITGLVLAFITVIVSIAVNYAVYTSTDDALADFETNAVQTLEPETRDTSKPAEPKVSMEEQQAVASAQDYLDYGAFSKDGLIDQLSSEYGEAFPKDVATRAVESLDTDWSAEAVESAESYLEFDSFSCSGLVDQLSSEYGEQFTVKQAKHAGITVGLCPK